ncbi:MAG: flagellar hook-associated protein FlgL [Deltaproteobacteria bacterium]|nr:flagellar hook-associated protein FlgL [Deltaproteobacteria bacterium]
MRVSTLQSYRQATDSMMRTLADLFGINAKIASGKRINKPSDDATGIARALDYKVDISTGEQYLKNIREAETSIGFAENTLSSVSSALTRATELAIQGANGTIDASSRSAIAAETGQLRDQLLSLANSKLGNRYVFSGFRTDTASFDASFAYRGDSGSVNAMIARDTLLSQNVGGQTAFGYAPASEEVVALDGGEIAHYIPGAGTTVTVEIRASDDTTVLDSFSFDNAMQIADRLTVALESNDTRRITALIKPLQDMASRVSDVRADLGARLNRLEDQGDRIEETNLSTKASLSSVEDADIVTAASDIARTNIALQALQASSAKILQRSLLDFLD